MLRPFRPALENLEKREVFSAAPFADMSPAIDPETTLSAWYAKFDGVDGAAVVAHAETFLGGGNDGNNQALGVAVGDFNNDGRPDLAASGLMADFDGDGDVDGADFLRSPKSGALGVDSGVDFTHPDLNRAVVDDLIGWNFLLPYIEPDNLYKFSNTMLDDQAVVAPVDLDGLGDAGAGGHDALFTELEAGELARQPNEGNQIIAVLIGLLANRSEESALASKDANHITDITDGTSNTLLFVQRGDGFFPEVQIDLC